MSAGPPDVLVITAEHEEELSATAALVLVTVQGTSLFTGSAALSKAKEVARLVEELARCGLASSAISLRGVQVDVASGILGKLSAAVYRLELECENLEILPDVLGAVTSAKNVRLEELVWVFPSSTEQYASWLKRAIGEANAKARAAASALGTRIAGIHHFTEQRLGADERRSSRSDTAAMMGLARARSAPVELGFELTQRRRAGVRVTLQYRVEGYAPA